MKKIAVIGSSGGNLRSQGGADPQKMMAEIFAQAKAAGIEVSAVQFILTEGSLDKVSMDMTATLFSLDEMGQLITGKQQKLSEINKQAKRMDQQLAQRILNGEIDGLMLLSCDPKGVNNQALSAAATMNIPVAGTGGTSMAETASLGVRIIAQSGTTGTTNRTRAISAISAFAKEWQLKYTPVIGSAGNQQLETNVFKRISLRGIMMAAMPGFIGMALSLALSKLPGLSGLEDIFTTLVGFLPVIVATIAAKQISGMDEVGIVAGVLAGALAVDGGIIGGMAVGILAGLLAGLVGKYLLSPIALTLGNGIKQAIDAVLAFNPILAGTVAGALIWFAIIGGVYHAAILPIVLLEMEATGFSFLGAIDMVCLVIVCAGIQLAYIIKPRNAGDRPTAIANIFINLLFGTFVEAAYPFMFSNKKVFGGTILAATLAGTLVGFLNVRTTAYVPAFMAPLMSNDHLAATVIVMVCAFVMACVFTLLANVGGKQKD